MKIRLNRFTQAHYLFAFIVLISGMFFIFITPPLWGADEGQHFFRAYQISRGTIFQKPTLINGQVANGGTIPASFANLNNLRANDIADAVPGETKQVDSRNTYNVLAHISIHKDKLVANPYGKNIYSPLVYSAPAVGVLVGRVFSDTALPLLYSARIATLLLYTLLAFASIYVLRKRMIRWMFFAIALLPMSVFQASVVSPDSLLLGLSLLFSSTIYAIFHTDYTYSRTRVGIIAVTASLLSLVKAPYVVLVFILTILPISGGVSSRKRSFIRFGIPTLAVVVALLSLISVRGVVATPMNNADPSAQLNWIVGHPLHFVYNLVNSVLVLDWVPQIIGLFGSSFVLIPGVVSQVLMIGLVLIALSDTKKAIPETDKTSGTIYLLASLLTTLAIVTTLYLTWTPAGAHLVQGIQGRYFLPIIAFVLIGIRLTTRARLKFSEMNLAWGCTLLSSCALLTSIAWYYRILY